MKRVVMIAATVVVAAAGMVQPGWAARRCTPNTAVEAENAIRYMTELMVASSACRNTVYAEFALRNRIAIIGYQRAMIRHLHGTQAFDHWDTVLANQYSERQAAVPPVQFCQQATPLMQQASALDIKGFRAYAASRAVATEPKCDR